MNDPNNIAQEDKPLQLDEKDSTPGTQTGSDRKLTDRRTFLAGAEAFLGMTSVSSCSWQEFVQNHFERMTKKEIDETVERLNAEYKGKYGKAFVV